MKKLPFQSLALSEWIETRNTLHKYCRLVGAIRETLSLPLPHSQHTNLLLCRNGFTTSTIQKNVALPAHTFEVIIDLIYKKLRIESNYREPLYVALTGQSLNALCDETCSLLVDIGIKPPLERPSFLEGTRGRFDHEPVKNYWKIVKAVAKLLKKVKKDLLGESGPVQLRPDDFSLNLNWYGKESLAFNSSTVEQIEFGFSTGDENIPEMYFYVSAFLDTKLLDKFYDKSTLNQYDNYSKLAILPLNKLTKLSSPEERLLHFFKSIKPIFKSSKK